MFDEKTDIRPTKARKNLRTLYHQPLYNYSNEEKVKSYTDQINHDQKLDETIKYKFNKTIEYPREFIVTTEAIINQIRNYNSHRNEKSRIQNIELMITKVRNLISKLLNKVPLSTTVTVFDVFYKRKNKSTQVVRPLVETHPAVNIMFRIMLDMMKEEAKIKFHDKGLEVKHHFLQKYLEKSTKYIVFFLDFTKAFDSISRDKLRDVLTKIKLGRYIFLIDFLDLCKYKYDEELVYYKKYGIPQGLPISTYLFEMFVLDITMKYEKYFTILRYVDDICLIVKDWVNFETKLNEMLDEFQSYGLQLNYTKTGYISHNTDYQNANFSVITKEHPEKYLGKYITGKSIFNGLSYLDYSSIVEDTIEILKKDNVHFKSINRSFKWRYKWFLIIYNPTEDSEREKCWSLITNKYKDALTQIESATQCEFKINFNDIMLQVKLRNKPKNKCIEYLYNEI